MTHYVASVRVERVDVVEIPATPSRHKSTERIVKTITHITVSSPALEGLVNRTKAHLDLVEDGGDINTHERPTR